MLDRHCNNFFSTNPSYQMTSKGGEEFNFWVDEDGGKTKTGGHFEEEFDDYSERLWKSNTSRNVSNETLRLLPYNHHYSNISPRSRSHAITEARKELLEMIHDMPESTYELSLKDIVDEQLDPQQLHEGDGTDGTSFHFNTADTRIKKLKSRNTGRSRQMARSGSMEKETFMIKLFIPSSLSWKTKVKIRNGSKASPKPSLQGSNNHVNYDSGIKKFLAVGDGGRNNRSNSSSSSTNRSESISSCSSSGSSCFFLRCWPIFGTEKTKTGNPEDSFSE